MHRTESEEMLIQEPCDKSWSGAECNLVQHRILATKTDPHGRKHRTCQEEERFDSRKSVARRFVSAELLRSSPDSVSDRPPDASCWSGASLKSQQKARNKCKPLVSRTCKVILELLEKEETGSSWCIMVWCGR